MKLFIERTPTTPKITLDPSSNTFQIAGWSSPENSNKFYAPVLHWLNEYGATHLKDATFTFKMNYFNSSTVKVLYSIFQRLEKLHNAGNNIKIEWYYMNDDDKENFEDTLGKLIKLPLNFVEWKTDEAWHEHKKEFDQSVENRIINDRGRDDLTIE